MDRVRPSRPPSRPPSRKGHPLTPVLRPGSVAVVGASRDPTKRGHQVVRALLERGYQGRILPVNPRGGELLGLPVWESLEALPGPVDLAVVCTPAETTPETVARAGRAGVAGAVVLAVGFGERGEEGARLQGELRDAARSGGIRLVGPNTSGLLNLSVGLDLVGVPHVPRGRLALLAQSGNVTLGLLREAAARGGEGFSLCVGVGNEADIAFHEYLEFLAGDPHTRAILLYAEGFARGREFLETARRVVRRKPVVLLKGGRSSVGSEAARSHTGAVTTGHTTVRAALRQAGVVEVRRSDELLAVGEVVVRQPPARRRGGVAVLSDGGGQGTLAADALSELAVPLARLAPETQTRLRGLLGQGAGVANPVDLAGAGDRDPAVFSRAMEGLVADPGVAAVLLVGLFGGYGIRFSETLSEAEGAAAGELVRAARSAGVPLVVHSMYADADTPALRALREGEVPVVSSLETACRAVGAAFERRGHGSRGGGPEASRPGDSKGGGPVASLGSGRRVIHRARREGRSLLLETEIRRLLATYGVPQAPYRLCRTREEVEQAIRRAGGPVALKVLSGTVTHKTEAGGVVLRVEDPREGGRVGERMLASVRRWAERRGMDPDLRGVLVSPMLPPPVAELLVGVRRDPSFGPVLTVGAGGTGVELLADLAVRVLPVARPQVLAMLDELRMGPVLRGYRGRPGVDRGAVADLVLALGRFALDHPEVDEVEVNPVFAYRDRAMAVDARALLRAPGEGARTRRRRHG
jgi:acetate---CoA ligase (ADP-forming)